jgi:hypothetical protein
MRPIYAGISLVGQRYFTIRSQAEIIVNAGAGAGIWNILECLRLHWGNPQVYARAVLTVFYMKEIFKDNNEYRYLRGKITAESVNHHTV